jgi:hypothetical protein
MLMSDVNIINFAGDSVGMKKPRREGAPRLLVKRTFVKKFLIEVLGGQLR